MGNFFSWLFLTFLYFCLCSSFDCILNIVNDIEILDFVIIFWKTLTFVLKTVTLADFKIQSLFQSVHAYMWARTHTAPTILFAHLFVFRLWITLFQLDFFVSSIKLGIALWANLNIISFHRRATCWYDWCLVLILPRYIFTVFVIFAVLPSLCFPFCCKIFIWYL